MDWMRLLAPEPSDYIVSSLWARSDIDGGFLHESLFFLCSTSFVIWG